MLFRYVRSRISDLSANGHFRSLVESDSVLYKYQND